VTLTALPDLNIRRGRDPVDWIRQGKGEKERRERERGRMEGGDAKALPPRDL